MGKISQAINNEKGILFESDSYENTNTSIEHIGPIMNENHHKSMLLVNVLWAALVLISVITVRSFFIDQVADADQNLERLRAVTQNNNLLQEEHKKMQIAKKQLESKIQGLEQSMNDQLVKQKKLEGTLSMQKSQAVKKADTEVIVFKPDQNNCCFCSCENSAFEDSLQKFR